jgi:hypothetical protein
MCLHLGTEVGVSDLNAAFRLAAEVGHSRAEPWISI